MSIAFKNTDCTFLNHAKFVNKVYKNVSIGESYVINSRIFSIQTVKGKDNRKRSHNSREYLEETLIVKQMYDKLISELPTELKINIHSEHSLLSVSEVRALSTMLFEFNIFDHKNLNGGNNSHTPLKCKIKDEYFLLPQNSRFYCGCVIDTCKKILGTTFDIVIVDPPWWNKYIRRLKNSNEKLSYKMMYNEDIAAIPLKSLLSEHCLVAVWCTNAQSNIDAVKSIIFPQWGVEYVTTWYWLKVTVDMEPICPFAMGCKKQPYERLILGRVGDVSIPERQLIVSVPSALHSHKPPLLDLFKPYMKVQNPETLELFARYLLPNTTSVGFEPLKWQHISLYDKVGLINAGD